MNGRMKKELKKIADQLMPALETVEKKMTGKEVLEKFPDTLSLEGQPIEPGKYYTVPIMQEVDHFKKICDIYTTKGIQAVGEYVVEQNENFVKNTNMKPVTEGKIETGILKEDPDLVGEWSGKKCPKCKSELLVNKVGNYWCSFIECHYGLDSTESPAPEELEDYKKAE